MRGPQTQSGGRSNLSFDFKQIASPLKGFAMTKSAFFNRLYKGFTLIELVSVIALLGIMALAIVLISPSTNPARLDAAVKQVSSDIEHAKEHAMTTEKTSGVQFVAGGTYTVYEETTATPLIDPLTKEDMVVTLSSLYSGISISTNYTVEFNSFGAPTIGGGGSVSLTDGTTTKTVTVTTETGKVTIQ